MIIYFSKKFGRLKISCIFVKIKNRYFMKKIMIMVMLFLGTMIYAQDSFVKTYSKCVVKNNDVEEPAYDTEVTVVFNYEGEKIIKFYYPNDKVFKFRQVSGVDEGKTVGGYKYQLIKAVEIATAKEVLIQLFDDDSTLRVIISEGNTIELYNE
jgi:hypothetical protein